MKELTQEHLKSRLSYNPETGVFTWLVGQRAGKIAGCFNNHGYSITQINGKLYSAHRLAWLYVHGKFPSTDLDHKNCVKTDNRICNLRECSKSENATNVGIRRTNKSGFKGVSWDKDRKKWRAKICIDGKKKYLGHFITPELASAAYEAKARELHGDFYRATA